MKRKKKYKEPIEIEFWEERDRASIKVSDDNGKIIYRIWDEEVAEMIEEGWFEWDDAYSLMNYLLSIGLIELTKDGYLPEFYKTS